MRYEPKHMIAIGIRRPLHPHITEQLDRIPCERKCGLQHLQPVAKLALKQRMLENSLAECGALLRVKKRISHRTLRQRNADHAIRYAREVEHFEDQIDSSICRTEQVAFAFL